MSDPSKTITLGEMFAGLDSLFKELITLARKGASAKLIAKQIDPVNLARIEKNCGQPMDSTYIAYVLIHVAAHS